MRDEVRVEDWEWWGKENGRCVDEGRKRRKRFVGEENNRGGF